MATNNKFFDVQRVELNSIKSITSYGEKLFLGTKDGRLLTYLVKQNDKVEITLIKHDHSFSTHAVKHIDALHGLLFGLNNNVIKLYKIDEKIDTNIYSSYKMVYSGDETRDATLFVLNKLSAENNIQFCAATQKNVLKFYTWKTNELIQNRSIVALKDSPKQMIWFKCSICIAFNFGIAIYDVSIHFIICSRIRTLD